MPDRLEELAKQMKTGPASPSIPAPATTGANDVDLWGAAGESDTRNGVQREFDTLASRTPEQDAATPKMMRPMAHFGAGVIGAVGSPFIHPLDTIAGIGHTIMHPIDTASTMAADAIDDPAKFAGSMVGGADLGGAADLAASPLVRYLRPKPSSAVVGAPEMASRKLSAAVLPATKDASSFIKAAPQEVPNILDYAKRNNNPLNTQLEFSKAAQGNAQAARDFYENSILKPNDKLVKTSGSGFGQRTGESPDTYATLGEIDRRIVDINKQLDKPSLNADDARRALASKTDLQAEAEHLRGILHNSLSQATGIAPEEIANLRQRVGRSYELANDTDAAVTGRMQAQGKTDMAPLHLSQIPSRMLEFVRGGPTAIADRSFQRAIKNFPGEAQPLPTINAPGPTPAMAARPSLAKAAGIEAEPNPMVPTMEDTSGQVFARNRSLARRGMAVDMARDAESARNLTKSLRDNELMSTARRGQELAKTLRKKE